MDLLHVYVSLEHVYS